MTTFRRAGRGLPTYAFKFRTPDRIAVFSGDTTYSDNLVAFVKGADLLVHEVLLTSALDGLLKLVPNASRMREHIAPHTEAADVGRVAAAAGVKRLALTQFVSSYDPTLTDEDWARPVREHYAGELPSVTTCPTSEHVQNENRSRHLARGHEDKRWRARLPCARSQ